MQLADLNYKLHEETILRNIIDCELGALFYPLPESEHYKRLCLNRFHEYTNHQVQLYYKQDGK